MAASASKDLEDLTTCTICLETFTRPKRLPCEHSYCLSCLLLLGKNKSTIVCPYCQKEHTIPAGGPSGFSDNLLLNNLVDIRLPKARICADCNRRPSVDDCEHCSQLLCHKCLLEHCKLTMQLSSSVSQLKHNLTTTVHPDRKAKLETLKTILEKERSKMNEIFRSEAVNKLIEVKILLERADLLDKLMDVIAEFYAILRCEENQTKIENYISRVLGQTEACTSVDSLTDLKNNVSDVETLSRLIQTEHEELRFRYSTSKQDDLVQVEVGRTVMNVRGKHPTEHIVDIISRFVQESAETLANNVTPMYQSRDDYSVSLPYSPNDEAVIKESKKVSDRVVPVKIAQPVQETADEYTDERRCDVCGTSFITDDVRQSSEQLRQQHVTSPEHANMVKVYEKYQAEVKPFTEHMTDKVHRLLSDQRVLEELNPDVLQDFYIFKGMWHAFEAKRRDLESRRNWRSSGMLTLPIRGLTETYEQLSAKISACYTLRDRDFAEDELEQ